MKEHFQLDQRCGGPCRRVGPRLAIALAAVFSLVIGCDLPGPNARFVKQIDWIGRGQWIKVDTHVHSRFSDGNHSISELAKKASEYGCDAIAITDHADHNRKAATGEYFDEIKAARWQFPSLLILAGVEWNVPPFGGDEHATVLMPENLERELAEFKAEFDDYGRDDHSLERAAAGLGWLESRLGTEGDPPVVVLEHPSRQSDSSLEVAETFRQWRAISDVIVGLSGAPGHQAGEPNGSYEGQERTIDRWDPAVARVDDAWDRLLQEGLDVWGAGAPSDFHHADATTGWNDYWPGQFSETWAYVPERSANGLLRAFRAGSFFGVHGHIAREVEIQVDAPGLPRPAGAGETIEAAPGTKIVITARFRSPGRDWAGSPNQIDEVELIEVSSAGSRIVTSARPDSSGVTRLASSAVPDGGCILRIRGRRVVPDGPDLMFYSNPVRVVTARATLGLFENVSMRLWGGAALGLFAFMSLASHGLMARPAAVAVNMAKRRPRPVHSARGWFLAMAGACSLFAIYGSLLPFNFQPLPWEAARNRFLEFRAFPTARSNRVDFFVNAMLFVPIGFGLMGAVRARLSQPGRTLILSLIAILLAALLSLSIECAQVWVPDRVSSVADVLAQIGGMGVGIAAWLMTGAVIEGWISDLRFARRPLQRAEMLLRGVFVVIVLSNLLPFDLTINPYDLWQKFQNGKLVLAPFSDIQWSSDLFFELMLKGLTGIPIGMLAVTLGTVGRRLPLQAAVVGIGLVAGIELAQLFVESRFSSTTDVIVGGVGACVGVWLEQSLLAGSQSRPALQGAPQVRGLLAAAYLVFPCIVLWWPLEFSTDQSMVKAKLQALIDLPLSQLILGQSYLRGLSQITQRISLFVPFGLLVGASLRGGRRTLDRRPGLAFAGGVFIIAAAAVFVEAGQLFVPQRTPDGADILLATIGGVAGLATQRLIAAGATQAGVR